MRTALLPLFVIAAATVQADTGYALHSGDRVVFYGDSITDSTQYPNFIEIFTLTRYPKIDARFFNSGVGGDRVSGGWMGPIDQRLPQDVYAYHPTVVTVMLGMNDGAYRAFDDKIFKQYTDGFEHIAADFKKNIPNAKLWLIRPSPFDDVNQAPTFDPGYNSVLIRYGDYVQSLAGKIGAGVIDLNAPVVDALKKAKALDPDIAKRIIPDRVHPGNAGHLVMAWNVVKAWGLTPVVSRLTMDASGTLGSTERVQVKDLKTTPAKITWSETEEALPFPIDRGDPQMNLVMKATGLDGEMNIETVTITGLSAGNYKLSIDGKAIGTFADSQFAGGLNLGVLDTPMLRQAVTVGELTWRRAEVQKNWWRDIQFKFQGHNLKSLGGAIAGLQRLEAELVSLQRRTAQPIPHQFQVERVGP